jgi:hypothetical protein
MELLTTALFLALLAFIVWREWSATQERTDLIDRLMAKNFPEYKDNRAPEPNHFEVKPTDVVDIEDGREDMIGNGE